LIFSAKTGADFTDEKEIQDLVKVLDEITCVMIPGCQEQYNKVLDVYGRPSLLTRYWAPLVLFYFGGNAAIKFSFRQKDNINLWLREAAETAQDFAVHWLWEPMLKVWETIRMKDQQLALLSKEGLRSDMEVWLALAPRCEYAFSYHGTDLACYAYIVIGKNGSPIWTRSLSSL
jgi:nuclear-control-of-ATPase protein 2